MQLRQLMYVVRAGIGRVLLATLVVAGIGAGVSALDDPVVHVATARAYLVTSSPAGNQAAVAQLPGLRKLDYADLLASTIFLQGAINANGLTTPAAEIRKHLEISSPKNTALFDFTYTDPDPVLAARIATAAARQFVVSAPELDATDDVRATLIHDAAMSSATEDQWVPYVVNGAIAGFFGMLVVLIGRHLRNPRLGDLAPVTTVAGLPVSTIGAHEEFEAPTSSGASRTSLISASDDVRQFLREIREAGGLSNGSDPSAPNQRNQIIGVLSSHARWAEAHAFAERLAASGGDSLIIVTFPRKLRTAVPASR